ncbi:MAG: NAD-glutamate dehydrogenase, partial [Desulfuromonadales bacterium]|nr:NAD-glutamate dehydrogenase [Desulfuromonadales bacterium]
CAQWLDRRESPDCGAAPIGEYRAKVAEYQDGLGSIVPAAEWQGCQALIDELMEQGVSEALARQTAVLGFMEDFLPLVDITETTGSELHTAAIALEDVRQAFGLGQLLRRLEDVPQRDRWDRMNRKALESSLHASTLRICRQVLEECEGNMEIYVGRHKQKVRYYRHLR